MQRVGVGQLKPNQTKTLSTDFYWSIHTELMDMAIVFDVHNL